jgi:anti-anti-sigma factor
MSLTVKENRTAQALVLLPESRLDSVNAGEFQALVTDHIDAGEKNVIVDFSNLDYISSAGIRVMQLATEAQKKSGGRFMLCAMNDNISNVFRITGFDRIIDIADTLQDALARVPQP